jgi:DnaJ-class molecular chaperone
MRLRVVPAKDYYGILGLRKGASKKEIQEAYRRLALLFHPDRNKDGNAEERFKEISEAYAVLSGKEKEPARYAAQNPKHGTGSRGKGSTITCTAEKGEPDDEKGLLRDTRPEEGCLQG